MSAMYKPWKPTPCPGGCSHGKVYIVPDAYGRNGGYRFCRECPEGQRLVAADQEEAARQACRFREDQR